jgi:RHS repeat-associated protein
VELHLLQYFHSLLIVALILDQQDVVKIRIMCSSTCAVILKNHMLSHWRLQSEIIKDGNGNVAVLINAADGTLAANYEYAAFGEPVRVTGVMARNNPFRFPTKYADDESDLLYYGYRSYKPSMRWQVSDWLINSCWRGDVISPNPVQQAPRNPFQTP